MPSELQSPRRRNILGAAWGTFSLVMVGSLGAMVRFLFPTVLYEPPSVFKAGHIEDYREGHVSTRWKKEHKIFIVRRKSKLYALDATCTHLGCTTNWFAEEELIKCPCHGSIFTVAGDVVSGPAPVPLYRVATSLTSEGIILINKRIKANMPGEREGSGFWLKA